MLPLDASKSLAVKEAAPLVEPSASASAILTVGFIVAVPVIESGEFALTLVTVPLPPLQSHTHLQLH
jgi:hypothetical protein